MKVMKMMMLFVWFAQNFIQKVKVENHGFNVIGANFGLMKLVLKTTLPYIIFVIIVKLMIFNY
jgi:hypothetical protein